MKSFKELHREVVEYKPKASSRPYIIFGERGASNEPADDIVRQSLDRVLTVRIRQSALSREFENWREEARGEFKQKYTGFNPWMYYLHRRAMRRKWGEYLRSGFDWDVGESLHHLFSVGAASQTASSPTPIRPPRGDLLIENRERLPKAVWIEYYTEAGEKWYMPFVPDITKATAENPATVKQKFEAASMSEKCKTPMTRTEEWVQSFRTDC